MNRTHIAFLGRLAPVVHSEETNQAYIHALNDAYTVFGSGEHLEPVKRGTGILRTVLSTKYLTCRKKKLATPTSRFLQLYSRPSQDNPSSAAALYEKLSKVQDSPETSYHVYLMTALNESRSTWIRVLVHGTMVSDYVHFHLPRTDSGHDDLRLTVFGQSLAACSFTIRDLATTLLKEHIEEKEPAITDEDFVNCFGNIDDLVGLQDDIPVHDKRKSKRRKSTAQSSAKPGMEIHHKVLTGSAANRPESLLDQPKKPKTPNKDKPSGARPPLSSTPVATALYRQDVVSPRTPPSDSSVKRTRTSHGSTDRTERSRAQGRAEPPFSGTTISGDPRPMHTLQFQWREVPEAPSLDPVVVHQDTAVKNNTGGTTPPVPPSENDEASAAALEVWMHNLAMTVVGRHQGYSEVQAMKLVTAVFATCDRGYITENGLTLPAPLSQEDPELGHFPSQLEGPIKTILETSNAVQMEYARNTSAADWWRAFVLDVNRDLNQ